MDWKSLKLNDDGSVTVPYRWLYLHYYEALNILFRTENALRVFVYVILKDKFREKWGDINIQVSEEENTSINNLAAKRFSQAKRFGYLGYEITSPLMHLNSGELTHLITSDAYWQIFRKYFKGKKEIIQNKFDEIGTVRNALAHFRPIKDDDVALVKQNVKHVLLGIEECLTELAGTRFVVPTNTKENWYKALATLSIDLCDFQLYQSKLEEWIRIELTYNCPIISENKLWVSMITFNALNIITPSIITELPELASLLIFASEFIPYTSMTKETRPIFQKKISFTFKSDSLKKSYEEISAQLKELLIRIKSESELVEQDHLARGTLIEATGIRADLRKTEKASWWEVGTSSLQCPFTDKHPAEYWGGIGASGHDFIAASRQYPWMPTSISRSEIPF